MSVLILELNQNNFTHLDNLVRNEYAEKSIDEILMSDESMEEGFKVTGQLLHFKKPNKTSSTTIQLKNVNTGRTHILVDCARMMYLRFGMTMAVVMVKTDMIPIVLRLEDMLEIGQNVVVIDPSYNYNWRGLPVLKTIHPVLPASQPPVPLVFHNLPVDQLPTNMSSFCFEVDHIRVLSATFIESCDHTFCDGRYGMDCSRSYDAERMLVAQIRLFIPNIKAEWQPYSSRELTLNVFKKKLPSVYLSKNLKYFSMTRFLKDSLQQHRGFRILGWFQPEEGTSEIITSTYKLHVSSLQILGQKLPEYEHQPSAVSESAVEQRNETPKKKLKK